MGATLCEKRTRIGIKNKEGRGSVAAEDRQREENKEETTRARGRVEVDERERSGERPRIGLSPYLSYLERTNKDPKTLII